MEDIANHLIYVQSKTWHIPPEAHAIDNEVFWDYHAPFIKNLGAEIYPRDVIRYLDRRTDVAERLIKQFLSIWWLYRQSTERPMLEEDKDEIREYLRRQ